MGVMVTRRTLLQGIGGLSAAAFAGCTGEDAIEYNLEFEEQTADWELEYEAGRQTVGPTPAGVFVNDFNNDGRPDVLLTGDPEIALFENTGERFERSHALPALNVDNIDFGLFFDHNNSGWQDLLLVPRNGTLRFLENESGEFVERTVGLEHSIEVGTAATAADCTGNGYPDVFVLQNGDWEREVPDPDADDDDVIRGGGNFLFYNEAGSFTRAEDVGIDRKRWSLATSFADFTGNGWPDIHVANDFGYDTLYQNRGDGTFESHDIPETNRHGMASAVADLARNGRPDVFVTNIRFENPQQYHLDETSKTVNLEGNNLLVNHGEGEFEDAAAEEGVDTGYWGWAAVAMDFLNNGYYDLVHATQTMEFYGQGRWEEERFTPRFWSGDEDGYTLENGRALGFAETNGRGMAWLDVDGSGQCDLIIGDLAGFYPFYRNVSSVGNWLQVTLSGHPDQTVIGSEVLVVAGGKEYYKQAHLQTDYLAQSSDVLHFGIGDSDSVEEVRVTWPDGSETTRTDLEVNQRIEIQLNG